MPSSPAIHPEHQKARSSGAFVVAVGVHVAALLLVPEFRATLRSLAPSSAEFVEVDAVVPEPTPPPTPAPVREAPRVRPNVTAPPPEPTVAPRPNEPPPAADEAVEEIQNLTLTNDSNSASFSVPAGTGVESTRPIASGQVTGREVAGTPGGVVGGTPGGTGPVSDENLSVRASQPSGLSDILQELFPDSARAQGVEGEAIVAVEIRTDGTVGRTRIVREAPRGFGFGQACVATLRRGGSWTPARDQAGNIVVSERRFPCRFSLSR